MKWFGERWEATICDTAEHTKTPVGTSCYGCCGKSIEEGDQGFVVPVIDSPDELSIHKKCFVRTVFGRDDDHTGHFDKPEREYQPFLPDDVLEGWKPLS